MRFTIANRRDESSPAKNPFIDADGFQQYIASFEKSYKEQMNRERQK